MRGVVAVGLLALLPLAAACGDEETSSTTVTPEAARYDETGPHAVEMLMTDFDGSAGAEGSVTIWYPADGATDDRFPLVVFSHGLAGAAADHEPQLAHLASWGVVAAAPEQLKGVDLLAVADGVGEIARDETSPLNGVLAEGGSMVTGGFSAGTNPATLAAVDGDVAGVLLLGAGGSPKALAEIDEPALFLAGGRDAGTADWVEGGYAAAAGPHMLVTLQDAGHVSFESACLDPERAAARPPVDCAPPEVGDASLQPLIKHAMVAFTRQVLGLDDASEALEPEVLNSLGAGLTIEGSLNDG